MWRMALTRMSHNEMKSACTLHSVSDDGTVQDLRQRLGELPPCDEQVAVFARNPQLEKAEILFWVREAHLREQRRKPDVQAGAEAEAQPQTLSAQAQTKSKSSVLPACDSDDFGRDETQLRQPPPRPPSVPSRQPPAIFEPGDANMVARERGPTQPQPVQTEARAEMETEKGAKFGMQAKAAMSDSVDLDSISAEHGTKRAVAKRRRSPTQKGPSKRRRDASPSSTPSPSVQPSHTEILEEEGFGWCCVPCKLWMPEGSGVCLKCGCARVDPTNSNPSNRRAHEKKDSNVARKRTNNVVAMSPVSRSTESEDSSPEADWCCEKCKVWMPSSQHICAVCHQPPDQNHSANDPGIPEMSSFSAMRFRPSSPDIESDPALPSKHKTSGHWIMSANSKRPKLRAKKVHRPITKRGTSRPESTPEVTDSTTVAPSQPNTSPDAEQDQTAEQVGELVELTRNPGISSHKE